MRILSWNVERIKAGAERVAREILSHEPDVVALQEFQPGNAGIELTKILKNETFNFRHDTAFHKGFCSVIFSRLPAHASPAPFGLPPDNWGSYWVEANCGGVGFSCLHIPVPKYREQRQIFWETAVRHCAETSGKSHILIGDFNTTRHGIDELGKTVRGDKWLQALETTGWQEAWRVSNPGIKEYSWYSKSQGFRFDQAWLSPVTASRLLRATMNHTARKDNLSDHSILIVDLDS